MVIDRLLILEVRLTMSGLDIDLGSPCAHCSIWGILRSKFKHDNFPCSSIKMVSLIIIVKLV